MSDETRKVLLELWDFFENKRIDWNSQSRASDPPAVRVFDSGFASGMIYATDKIMELLK